MTVMADYETNADKVSLCRGGRDSAVCQIASSMTNFRQICLGESYRVSRARL
jgi:hypothetical protein